MAPPMANLLGLLFSGSRSFIGSGSSVWSGIKQTSFGTDEMKDVVERCSNRGPKVAFVTD